MKELTNKILALGCGVFVLSPSVRADFDIGFEVDEDSPRVRCAFWEQHPNRDFKEPWEKWTCRREQSYATIEDGLNKYLVNGKPLKDCIEDITPELPM